jgi:hypothetical protein
MNAITTIRPAAPFVAPKFKGKGAQARTVAFIDIAPLSYNESVTRSDTIAALRTALGSKPTAEELVAARNEWMCGRMAFRLPAGEFPRDVTETINKLDFARALILHYAKAPKDGAPKVALRKGKLGYRSATQQKVMNAAQEAWSQLLAELGLNGAQKQDDRNAAKRAPQMAGSTARGKATKTATPNASQLVAAPAPMTAEDFAAHLVAQATALMQFCKKNAKLGDAAMMTLVNAFHRDIAKRDGERRLAAK